MDKPYTVLLLYPDYADMDCSPADNTYLAHVRGSDRDEAVANARVQCLVDSDWTEDNCDPMDFAEVIVFAGHHDAV